MDGATQVGGALLAMSPTRSPVGIAGLLAAHQIPWVEERDDVEDRCSDCEGMRSPAAELAAITTVIALTRHAFGTLRIVDVSLG